MKRSCLAIAIIAALGGCSDFPRDSASTLDHVRNGSIRVGHSGRAGADPGLAMFIQTLSTRLNARPVESTGETEVLLSRLETGDLDIVVGTFELDSPWMTRVTFSKPLAKLAGGALEAKAAVRNGEHAWAMEVDRAAKLVAEEAR